MRKPIVENKYNLNIAKIKDLGFNRELVGEPLFWRNEGIKGWCISRGVGKGPSGASESTFWIGIYDKRNKIRFYFTCMEDMCGYNFEEFFKKDDIENIFDLEIQEAFLSTVNYLIDIGVFYIK